MLQQQQQQQQQLLLLLLLLNIRIMQSVYLDKPVGWLVTNLWDRGSNRANV